MAMPPGNPLLERAEEIARAQARIPSATSGAGATLFVEGPAGIGKSRLLSRIGELAADAGMAVHTARACELERDFAYGLVRQLLEPLVPAYPLGVTGGCVPEAARVLRTGPVAAGAPGEMPGLTLLTGFYRLFAHATRTQPQVLVVDDVQWGDLTSIRFLTFLASRVDTLPALLVLARRHGECAVRDEHLAAIGGPSLTTLRPRPLSLDAVTLLVAQAFGTRPDAGFAAACHRAVAGNPFMLRELLGELRRERVAPGAREAAAVASLCPRTISRAVLLRLGTLEPQALEIARTVAVLGDGCELHEAAALSGMEAGAAGEAVDALVRIAILRRDRRLAFVHPIVRAAIAQDMGALEFGRRHACAAQLLLDMGAPVERVAAHVCETEAGAAGRGTDRVLRLAASAAARCGAPDTAVAYLRRAVEEPQGPAERAELELELGLLEERVNDPAGLVRLLKVAHAAPDGELRWRASVAAGRAKARSCGQLTELRRAFARARSALPPGSGPAARALDAERLAIAVLDPSGAHAALEELSRLEHLPRGPAGTVLLAVTAYTAAQAAAPVVQALDPARRALARQDELTAEGADAIPFMQATSVLVVADRYDEAEEHYARAGADGCSSGVGALAVMRSQVADRRGRLADAEAHARAALAVAIPHGMRLVELQASASLADALLEQGRLEEADAVLRCATSVAAPAAGAFLHGLLHARGRLRIAQGHLREGLQDLFDCGRHEEALGALNPARFPWRSDAARALAALGEHADARALAERELELARRFGAARALGIALRAAAAVAEAPAAVELQREAAATLGSSEADLEYAKALCDLGRGLSSTGASNEARATLRAARQAADDCGGVLVAEQARQALVRLGDRPRRAATSGPRALTASEERVAGLAAEGLSNLAIAATLVVSPKTVEKHLRASFRKLGVASRRDLRRALASDHVRGARAGPGRPELHGRPAA